MRRQRDLSFIAVVLFSRNQSGGMALNYVFIGVCVNEVFSFFGLTLLFVRI